MHAERARSSDHVRRFSRAACCSPLPEIRRAEPALRCRLKNRAERSGAVCPRTRTLTQQIEARAAHPAGMAARISQALESHQVPAALLRDSAQGRCCHFAENESVLNLDRFAPGHERLDSGRQIGMTAHHCFGARFGQHIGMAGPGMRTAGEADHPHAGCLGRMHAV